jgi:SAM-dependent methyltransferase
VTAVDAAPRMVSLLRAAGPDIDARLMDAAALDLPAASFDVASAAFVVHVVDDAQAMLAGMLGALRPGGRIALTVPGGPRPVPDRWEPFHRIVGEFVARADPARLPGHQLDVEVALAGAGFTGYRTGTIAVHLPVSDPATCWEFHMSHGFAGVVHALAPADRVEFHARAMADLERMHDEGGIVVDSSAVVHLAIRGAVGSDMSSP